MWRIFSLAILALIPVGRVGAQDKRSLIVEVLQTAGDYGDIAPVWGIVQKDGDIYRFVPSVAPLKEKSRLKQVLSYTERPPRFEGEGGHTFVTPEEFDKLKNLCAYTVFDGHRYGVPAEMVEVSDIYVIDPAGVAYMKEHYSGKKGVKVVGKENV